MKKYLPLTFLYLCILLVCGSPLNGWANVVEKNKHDKRQFEFVTLNNGLKTLFIFDPESKKAAASLDVRTGSAQDPEAFPGLAHLLEHLLVTASQKYPTAGQFEHFVERNGGYANAYTSVTHSNFHFDVSPAVLNETLDRFAQMFTAPNFNLEHVEKEIAAIHLEYQQSFNSPKRREQDVLRELMVPGHELNRFATGNVFSFNASDGASKAQLQNALIKMFEQKYVAKQMTLVVSSPFAIADMKEYVIPKFSSIAAGHIQQNTLQEKVFTDDAFGSIIEMQSLGDKKTLSLYFPVPSSRQYYQQKPLEYISHLIEHKDDGSLYALFTKLGWISDLQTSVQYAWQDGEVFAIELSLTETGLVQAEMIQQLIMDYLQVLQSDGVSPQRYEMLSDQSRLAFAHYDKVQALEAVQSFASSLHDVKPKQLIASQFVFADYAPALIKNYLNLLVANNSLAVLSHPFVNILEEPSLSKDYHVKHIVHHAKGKIIPQLDLVQTEQVEKYRKQLKLPGASDYVSTRLDLVKHTEKQQEIVHPRIIRSKNGVTTWFMPDLVHQQPKTFIQSRWLMPNFSESADAVVAARLLLKLIEKELQEELYEAKLAGLNFAIEQSDRGLTLSLHGYSKGLDKFLDSVMEVMHEGINERSERWHMAKAFYVSVKQELLSEERNKNIAQSYLHAHRELSAVLHKPRWSEEALSLALQNMDEKKFLSVSRKLFQGAKVELLVYGNENESGAIDIARHYEKIQRKNHSQPKLFPSLVVDISDERQMYVKSLSDTVTDNTLVLYIQGHEDTLKERAKFLILDQMIKAPFYDYLHNEKQLSFAVQSDQYQINTVPGLLCVVQNAKASPQEIYQLVNRFFYERSTDLFTRFQSSRQQVLHQLTRMPVSQKEIADDYWASIVSGDHQFNDRQKLHDIVSNMSLYKMKSFYYSRVLNDAGRVVFAGNVFAGNNGPLNAKDFAENALLITDTLSFKNSMPVYLYP